MLRSEEIARHELPLPLPERIEFAHGTSTAAWGSSTRVRHDFGQGEYGRGFYVFRATAAGIERATQWAGQQAARWRERGVAAEALLVIVTMNLPDFAGLYRHEVTIESLEAVCKAYRGAHGTQWELMFGPLANAKNRPLRGFPLQYKFEARGINLLSVDRTEEI